MVKKREECAGYRCEVNDLKQKCIESDHELSKLEKQSDTLQRQLSEQKMFCNRLSELEHRILDKNRTIERENQRLNLELTKSENKYIHIQQQLTQLQNINISLNIKNHDQCLAMQKKGSISSTLRTDNHALRKRSELQSMEISEKSRTAELLIQEKHAATERNDTLSTELKHLEASKYTEVAELSKLLSSTRQTHTTVLEKMQEKQLQSDEIQKKLEEEIQNLKVQVSELQQENESLKEKCKNWSPVHHQDGQVDKSENPEDLRMKLLTTVTTRRNLFDEIQDHRGNVRVFCRIRPPKPETLVQPFINHRE